MTTTAGQIFLGIFPALQRLGAKDLPIAIQFRVLTILKALQPHAETLDKLRLQLLEKHGKKTADGKGYGFESDAKALECDAEFKSLCAEKVDVAIEPLRMADLGTVTITAADLAALESVITP